MGKPFFSIITVTLNDKRGLERTLISVQNQTHKNFEHIIIDGDSTDGSKELLASIKSYRNMKWQSQPDNGIFDAMNKGIHMAQGKYLVFMNSGDVFAENSTLSTVFPFLNNERTNWAFGEMRLVDKNMKILMHSNQRNLTQRKLRFGLAYAPHQSTYYKGEFLKSLGGYDASFQFAADQELAYRAFQESSPIVIPEILCDFLEGGLHSRQGILLRELLYHQLRVKNKALLLRSKILDICFVGVIAFYRKNRRFLSSQFKGF